MIVHPTRRRNTEGNNASGQHSDIRKHRRAAKIISLSIATTFGQQLRHEVIQPACLDAMQTCALLSLEPEPPVYALRARRLAHAARESIAPSERESWGWN
ncbi:jg8317 [Pararge aegeria aegeria]|uniref:Jg8317 protein n=1 Tax=Pararge aegeria aegeria TaxID=348720 RepID=A0A8S4SIM2_9NEOP|nr:jg8317 [Pararge aegeria aegeria]